MYVRNAVFNSSGTIDCEIEHPVYGWLPFTASPDDTEELGRTIYAEAVSGKYGDIAPYVAPVIPLEERIAQVQALRLAAYRAESDQLKIAAEFDALQSGVQADYSQWIAAVEAIKQRYPLPTA